MSRWFRHYAGMMRDEKLVAVAIKAKQPVERVLWVWGAILESAAEVNDGGRFDLDVGEAAYFLRTDDADIQAILDALAASGRLADGIVVNWSDRQYQSDASAQRQAAYRERKRAKEANADVPKTNSDVTPPSRDAEVTPQESETDTDITTQQAGGCELEALEGKLREAAGWQNDPSPNLFVTGPVHNLITQGGCSLELDVLPTIRARASRHRGRRNWNYFLEAIQQARDDRLSASRPPDLTNARGPNATTQNRNSIANSFAAVDAAIAERERELERLEGGARTGGESPKLVSGLR